MIALRIVPWVILIVGIIIVLYCLGIGLNQSEFLEVACFLGIASRIVQAEVHQMKK